MRKFKKIFLAVLFIVILITIAGFIFAQSMKPEYKGQKKLPHLSGKVKVYYDPYGIPHIYAGNEEDAFRALGYVHAQDRLWQMELLRRVASGGLSEVFGKDLLATDKLFLNLGIDEASTKVISQLKKDSPVMRLSEAYLDGINQFIEQGPTPIEFYLTGIAKRPFTIRDVLNSIGYMGFSFAMGLKTDPLLTNIRNSLGKEYLDDLEFDSDTVTQRIKNYNGPASTALNDIPAMTLAALDKLPVPPFIGSNSWVIGPGKTNNGKVILANDPHIAFAQPCVWFEAHITTPGFEKYGYYLAGIPFPLLGHDRNVAYGITMFENDDMDFYYEETNPEDSTRYKTEDGWQKFEYVTRSIRVKGESPMDFTYKKTRHGPVMTALKEPVNGKEPISMSWVYTKLENRVLDALYGISHAEDLASFKNAISSIAAPGLNMMYGDAKGNIAWWASAQLYTMPDSVNTRLILAGPAGKDEPVRLLDFSENPHAVNPPWHYVYSANNQPDSVAGILYPGYYMPENRAKRIVQLLEAKNNWDGDSVREMITDMTSSVNPAIVMDLAKQIDVSKLTDKQARVLDKLTSWKGDYPLESVAATVFHRWIYYFLKNTFLDELGEERFSQLLQTHFHNRLIAPMARKANSLWWDDTSTDGIIETKKDIVNASFIEAIESLTRNLGEDPETWTWDRVHTLENSHPIGKVASLRSFFNVGPFPIEGTREVINNMSFTYTEDGGNNVTSGPSTRRVIDFSDIENSMSILPTGQSGNPFSSHYKDQAEMYIHGKFRKMMMNRKEIQRTSASLLTFIPALTDKNE